MERYGTIDIATLVAIPARSPARVQGPAHPDWRRTVILVLIGVMVVAVALEGGLT